jgi:GxxExxY protein
MGGIMTENEIGTKIIEAAIEVHRHLGPGLLESVYETALVHELSKRGLDASNQVPVHVDYDGNRLGIGFRADVLVESKVMVEIKSVETVIRKDKKPLINYLKLSRKKLGYLINFNVVLLKDGISRMVNGLEERQDQDFAESKEIE